MGLTEDEGPRLTLDAGVWVAYAEDWSQVAVFREAVEASDFADENSLLWAFCPWGETMGPDTIVVEGLIGGP